MKKKLLYIFALIVAAALIAPSYNLAQAKNSVSLTSITLDPEDSTGQTTNAPGAWSTSTGDGLSQVGVNQKGIFLNNPIGSLSNSLGEISIPLKPGENKFTLYGNRYFPNNLYYGAVLFFDGRQVHPRIAVYNKNGGLGNFLIQPRGNMDDPLSGLYIMGNANGGWFFDAAPGTSAYTAPNGTKVEVKSYTVDSVNSTNSDLISYYYIGADGLPDTVANLTLRVTPTVKNIQTTIDQMYTDGTIKGLGNSLYSKLDKAQVSLDADEYTQAKNILQALIHEIKAQLGKKIDTVAGNNLISQIQDFINDLP